MQSLKETEFDHEIDALPSAVESARTGLAILSQESSGVILLRGPQAEIFLNGVVTNNLATLQTGQLQQNLLCANKGKILFEISIVRSKPEEFLLLTGPAETDPVVGHLNFYHIREEFQMGQPGLVRVDILGETAAKTFARMGLAPAAADGRFNEGPLVTVASPLGRVPRVIALLPAPNLEALIDGLLSADPGGRSIGPEVVEELRIQERLPRFGTDYGSEHLPAEAALYSHIDFNKGCYIGQEIHARMHYRGHPNRKLIAVDLPEIAGWNWEEGGLLYHQGKAVGEITSLSKLPVEGKRHGIAMVRYTNVTAGAPLAHTPAAHPLITLQPLSTDLGQNRS